MTLRGQTGDVQTRYVVNGGALKSIRESEQFRIVTGKAAATIECHTTATFDNFEAQVATYAMAKYSLTLLVDNDWARFQQFVREWHEQRGIVSSPIQMAMCPAYQQIIAMGKPAIRLIFRQLELEGDDPDHWFWALSYLTGVDPVRPESRGNLKKMRADWMRWGQENRNAW
jgi:hypothetical protein